MKLQEVVLNPDTSQGMNSSVGRERSEWRKAVKGSGVSGRQRNASCGAAPYNRCKRRELEAAESKWNGKYYKYYTPH